MARNPAALVAALKTAPVAKDQFNGGDFPGSYLWRKGGLDPEEFGDERQAKAGELKIPKLKAPKLPHIPGVKFNGR